MVHRAYDRIGCQEAELDDVAALLEATGLLTVEGYELTLTAEGAALGRALAMGEGEEVLDALLGGREEQAE